MLHYFLIRLQQIHEFKELKTESILTSIFILDACKHDCKLLLIQAERNTKWTAEEDSNVPLSYNFLASRR